MIKKNEDSKEEKKDEEEYYLELTDSFDFWNDQSSHNYETFGHTQSGAYVCDGETSLSNFSYQFEPR